MNAPMIHLDLTPKSLSNHWMMLDLARPFLLINAEGENLSDEPVAVEDLTPISAQGRIISMYASWAWSSDVRWFIVITPQGLALFDLDGIGWLCPKRSSDFIRLFIEAPIDRKRRLA